MPKKKKNEVFKNVDNVLKDVKNIKFNVGKYKGSVTRSGKTVSVTARKKNFWER